MADLIKANFRATYGFDAAGEKVVNVATADKTQLQDGVNVDFFIKENTIQVYDETRGYPDGFAVIYDNRIWISNVEITKPAGPFQNAYWDPIRTDPKWQFVTQGPWALESGQYINADSSVNNLIFTLPNNPQTGDTIFVKDVGGVPGYNQIKINSSVQRINFKGQQLIDFTLTRPYSQLMFVFSNRLWQLFVGEDEVLGKIVTPTGVKQRVQSGDFIIRRYTSSAPILLELPKYAMHGDMIKTVDLDGLSPLNHLIVSTFDDTTSLCQVGTHSSEFRTSADGFFVFDAVNALWRVFDADQQTRLEVLTEDTDLSPNTSVMVMGENNVNVQTITLTLPTNVAIGDTVQISLGYLRLGQTCIIKATVPDMIASTKRLLQFPRRSEYPPDQDWYTDTQLVFQGYTDYAPTLELAYLETGTKKYWVVAENIPIIEQVDPKTDETRKRLGVIALASQAQANIDYENTPETALAITPQTLANRIATMVRRGIARIATTAEVNQISTATYLDDVIITPKKLNERTATETRRGLAEIATQAEVTAGTDDITIVSPLKLATRKATEILDGIIALVKKGATPAASRDVPGTNVYDYTDHKKAVTPAVLNEAKATKTTLGLVFQATETEVISAPVDLPLVPLAISPEMLHKKTATKTRIGFTQTATQVEVNAGTDDFKYVTPKTLNDRNATEVLTGISRYATQAEFDAGVLDNVISTPLKIKTRFNSTDRTGVNSVSGLTESGTLWDHYTLDIKAASYTQRGTARLSTQAEVNAGTNADTIVTPLTLANKKATEAVDGIIRLATQAETVAGTSAVLAVNPKNLKYIAQTETTWESTPARRGFVKISEGTITWMGDKVNGSVDNIDTFVKNGFAISPYELNKTLANYLPIQAKAVDSDKLDGIDSLQFIRRDINQTVEGEITLTAPTHITAAIDSTSTALFTDINATKTATVGNTTGSAIVNLAAKANAWTLTAGQDGSTLTFNDVLTLNRNGNAIVKTSLNVGNQVDSKIFLVGSKVVAESPTTTTLALGNTSLGLTVKALDAGNILATDNTPYRVLTEKNNIEITNRNFVNKGGDTMTGRLTVNAAVTIKLGETNVTIKPTEATRGMWTAEVTTASIYNLLPGYMVPVFTEGTNVVESYNEFKGPGTLSQFGAGTNFTYQVWAPRPTTLIDNHGARTTWIRNFNPVINDWDTWGRVFTSAQPPTASDIGAAAISGSTFDNLTIRDWIQIKNVRIVPNPVTKVVEFIWID